MKAKETRSVFFFSKKETISDYVPSLVLLCTHTFVSGYRYSLWRISVFSKYTVTQDIGRSIIIIFSRFYRGDGRTIFLLEYNIICRTPAQQ